MCDFTYGFPLYSIVFFFIPYTHTHSLLTIYNIFKIKMSPPHTFHSADIFKPKPNKTETHWNVLAMGTWEQRIKKIHSISKGIFCSKWWHWQKKYSCNSFLFFQCGSYESLYLVPLLCFLSNQFVWMHYIWKCAKNRQIYLRKWDRREEREHLGYEIMNRNKEMYVLFPLKGLNVVCLNRHEPSSYDE